MSEDIRLGSSYVLHEKLGSGSMGEVWRGTDAAGNTVAAKLILPHLATNPEYIRRFLDEWHAMSRVHGRHVVEMRDLVVESGRAAIVTEFIDGSDLRALLKKERRLPLAHACYLAAQVADGLASVHQERIVHRDVKPENVLLDRSGAGIAAKLTDFGVAKIADDTTTAQTVIAGTVAYMAPEIILGLPPVPQSDMYSLGIVFYELLTGLRPFEAEPDGVRAATLFRDPGRIPGLPDDVWAVVAELTAKDPDARPADDATLAARLRDLGERHSGHPELPTLTTPPPSTPSSSTDPAAATSVSASPYVPTSASSADQRVPTPVWSSQSLPQASAAGSQLGSGLRTDAGYGVPAPMPWSAAPVDEAGGSGRMKLVAGLLAVLLVLLVAVLILLLTNP